MTDHSLHFDPSCEECAYLARPVAIPVPPSPVAGLREAVEKYVDWEYRVRGAKRFTLTDLRAALHREDGA